MLIGILIVILGIILLLNELNLGFTIDFNYFLPVLFLVSSIYLIIKNKKISFFPIVLFIVGLTQLLDNFEIDISNYIWPIIIISLGLSIIISKMQFKKNIIKYEVNKDGIIEFNGIFGGIEDKIKINDFKGAEINSIFGGVDLDLSEIKIKDDIKIEINSIFGGTTIKLPEEYNVVVSPFSFFGGTENKENRMFDEKRKTIYIHCVSVFGGTELK